MEKQRHGEISNLLLRKLVGRDEVERLEVAKLDIPAEDVNVQELVTTSAIQVLD